MIGTDKIFQGVELEEATLVNIIKALRKEAPFSHLQSIVISFQEVTEVQANRIAEALQYEGPSILNLSITGLTEEAKNNLLMAISTSNTLDNVSVTFDLKHYNGKNAISEALSVHMANKLANALAENDERDDSENQEDERGLLSQVSHELTALYNGSRELVQSYLSDVSQLTAACAACLPSSPKPKME